MAWHWWSTLLGNGIYTKNVGGAMYIVSSKGIEALKKLEEFRGSAYKDSGGKLTIGYGHLIKQTEKFTKLTEVEAVALLRSDIKSFEDTVNTAVHVPLLAYQFDALVIFAFNIGGAAFSGSTLVKLLNAGRYNEAAAQFARWNKILNATTGVLEPCRGLTNRRKCELSIYQGVYP